MVLAAYCSVMTSRIAELLRRVWVERDSVITGEISKNVGIVKRLESIIGIKALPTKKEFNPIIAGAIGAGLFAKDFCEKERKDV